MTARDPVRAGGTDLFLHIGHNKTGSSYIQSSLSLSAEALQAHGLAYPAHGNMAGARLGHTTSGNGEWLLGALKDPSLLAGLEGGRVVLSSELIFRWLKDREFRDGLAGLARDGHVGALHVLLLVRDPVSLTCASYRQRVKGGRATHDIEEHFERAVDPAHASASNVRPVNRALDFFATIPEARISVHNYSCAAVRDALLPITEAWLGVPPESLKVPPAGVVNRSLTVAETRLLLLLNARLGGAAHVVGNAFSDRLPDVSSQEIRPSMAAQTRLWAALAEEIARFNDRVPPEARYVQDRDIRAGARVPGDAFAFTQNQLEIIADAISAPRLDARALRETLQDLKGRNGRLRAGLEARNRQIADLKARLAERGARGERGGTDPERVGKRPVLARLRRKLAALRDRARSAGP